MSILKELKTETAALHKELEGIAFSSKILDFTLSLDEYIKLIRGNYLFCTRVESSFKDYPELMDEFDLKLRAKSSHLEKDRETLAIKFDSKEKAGSGFYPENESGFLGMLYVQEGSTLGGAVIARHLILNPNLSGVKSFHFYGCYGEKTGEMWKKFTAGLEARYSCGKLNRDSLLSGAVRSFELVKMLLS